MTTHFILVRHGQTDWNRVERFRGRADIPLNETGIEQARRAATHLAAEKVDLIHASPLLRTMHTAELIAEPHRLSVLPQPALIDLDYGTWQGLAPEEVAAREPELYREWLRAPERVTFLNGESLCQVRDRAMRALEQWGREHDGQTLLLVSHDMVWKIVLLTVLGAGGSAIRRLQQENAAINRADYENGQFTVVSINEVSHLA